VTLTQPTGKYGFITMTGDTAVEGVVKDASGAPVKGVVIRMEQETKCGQYAGKSWCHRMPYREATTDEQGRYRIFVEQDYYTVTIFGNALGTCEHGEVWVPKGEHKKMDFSGDPTVKLEADVVDAQTGEPVLDAELAILYFDMDKRWKGNGRGMVTVSGVFSGNCEFYPKHPDYARWWSEEAVNPWQRLDLVDNEKTGWQRNFDDLTFKVTAETAGRPVKIFMERAVIVRGRVLDPDGKPVAGATVDPAHTGTGNSLTGDTRFSAKTDAAGRYELRLPASNAAQYNLVAHDGKYKEWRQWANGVLPPVRTKPGDVLENVDIHLTQPGMVKGVVVDKEGKPVAGQRVRTEPVDRIENRYYDPETVTDKEGKFSLPFVRPGKHYLWAARWSHDPEDVKPEDLHIIEVKAGVTLEVKARKYED
jgi:protocatechuate 3,4-dioxygenase beta subunit